MVIQPMVIQPMASLGLKGKCCGWHFSAMTCRSMCRCYAKEVILFMELHQKCSEIITKYVCCIIFFFLYLVYNYSTSKKKKSVFDFSVMIYVQGLAGFNFNFSFNDNTLLLVFFIYSYTLLIYTDVNIFWLASRKVLLSLAERKAASLFWIDGVISERWGLQIHLPSQNLALNLDRREMTNTL